MSSNICPEHVYKDHFPLVPRAVFIYKFDCITVSSRTVFSASVKCMKVMRKAQTKHMSVRNMLNR